MGHLPPRQNHLFELAQRHQQGLLHPQVFAGHFDASVIQHMPGWACHIALHRHRLTLVDDLCLKIGLDPLRLIPAATAGRAGKRSQRPRRRPGLCALLQPQISLRIACMKFNDLKEWAQVVAWLVAAIGGVVTAWRAITEMRRARIERQEEFRWRQAELAKTILDETWADPLVVSAMRMLDWKGMRFDRGSEKTIPITREVMRRALRTEDTLFTDDEQFVRDSFDHLFDAFERIEHFRSIGLILWEDVHARLRYYVRHLARQKSVYAGFLNEYQFKLAQRMLEMFAEWKDAPEQCQNGAMPKPTLVGSEDAQPPIG